MRHLLHNYRRLLINYESVLAYSMLGVAGGVASGLVVLAFELAIRKLSGARNAVLQLVGGAFSLGTGQSGGREGPGVHLGGAINSLLGQWLGLPNNSLRMLIACGTAGGIAAAFHTPLAGVLFTMEVIIAEYTVAGFIPVMLAAVSASAVSRTLSIDDGLFSLPTLELSSLLELPYIIFLGLCCGIAVAALIRISKFAARFSDTPVAIRFALAGSFTGILALLAPQILGVGNETLNLALHGELALFALLLIALCKLLATAVSCGVGMPVGVIGPNLLIGACIGGMLGTVGTALRPDLASDPTLYIVIGMGAAMGAVLNAPLAAILVVIEMTQTLNISIAAMLAIVTATLTNTGLFGERSAHETVLRQLQRLVPREPLNQLLHRSSVTSTMDTRVVRVPVILAKADLEPLLEFKPAWCLVERGGDDLYLVNGSELLEWLKQLAFDDETADVSGAGIRRWAIASVPMQVTSRQATDTMRTDIAEAVCVYERSPNTGKQILHGVLTSESIEKYSLAGML